LRALHRQRDASDRIACAIMSARKGLPSLVRATAALTARVNADPKLRCSS
jgi:hypothetical protein